jgi:hypothetical protein
MKVAVLFSIPMVNSSGVCWRWRSTDGQTDSAKSFVSYYDCLFDAQSNGYSESPPAVWRDRSARGLRPA